MTPKKAADPTTLITKPPALGKDSFVRVIATRGAAALVEYEADGMLMRKYVPLDKIGPNQFVKDAVLASGIPYGFPWQEITINFDMQQFANEMHNADLWTVEDALANPKAITGVLRKIFETSFRAVLEAAAREKKRSL